MGTFDASDGWQSSTAQMVGTIGGQGWSVDKIGSISGTASVL